PSIAIAPITTTKSLVENGYTPEIASEKLRIAINKIFEKAPTRKQGADIARELQIPNIVVPNTGLSIEAITAQIRSALGIDRRWNIMGGIATENGRNVFRLKVSNERSSQWHEVSEETDKASDLFDVAARKIMNQVDPYILALSYRFSDPAQSFALSKRIIGTSHAVDPYLYWAHNLLGLLMMDKGNYEDAIAEYKLALRYEQSSKGFFCLVSDINLLCNDKRYAVAHTNLGIALDLSGKSEEAFHEYDKAMAIDATYSNVHLRRGMHYAATKDLTQAIAEYQQAIFYDANDKEMHHLLAIALANANRLGDAIDEYQVAISFDPKKADLHNDLGLALAANGKNQEAISEYDAAITLEPQYLLPRVNLAVLYHTMNKAEKAAETYAAALKIGPSNGMLHNDYGYELLKLGKLDEAAKEFETAVALDGGLTMARDNLAAVRERLAQAVAAKVATERLRSKEARH
ncbi:MAG: tetratricopeptide repeat protein, partial [Methylocystis sp.]